MAARESSHVFFIVIFIAFSDSEELMDTMCIIVVI